MKLRPITKFLHFLVSVSALVLVIESVGTPPTAHADSNVAIFTYNRATISQEIAVSNIGGSTSFEGEIAIRPFHQPSGLQSRQDDFAFQMDFINSSGTVLGSRRTPASGYTVLPLAQDYFTTHTLIAQSSDSDWSTLTTGLTKIKVSVTAIDTGYWSGNYGPYLDYVTVDQTTGGGSNQIVANSEFASGTSNWTSSIGWASACVTSGGGSTKPCVTNAYVAPATTSTSTTTTTSTSTTTTTTTPPTTTTTTPTPVADSTAPTISSLSPSNGASGVSTSANMVITFSENVLAVAGKDIVLRQSPSAAVVETIPANDTSQVTISGAQVTINPSSNLNQGASYYVLIDAGAFRDSAGNSIAGISSASTWQFTTTSSATTTTSAASTTTTTSATTTSSATSVTVQQRSNTSLAGSSSTTTSEPQGQSAVSTLPSTTTTSPPAVTSTTTSAQGATSRSNTTSTSTTTTTTTTTIAPSSPVAPEPPEAEVGEAAALVDGQPIKSTVVKSANAVMTIAGTVQVTVYAFDPEGQSVPVTLDGKILVEGGGSFGVRVAGFAPNSPVEAWLFSNPIRLGDFRANNYGKSTERYVVPTYVEPGSHRVVLTGTNALGKKITVAVGLQVRGDTGEVPTSRIVIIAIAALALLGLLLPPSLRRRRTEPTESL